MLYSKQMLFLQSYSRLFLINFKSTSWGKCYITTFYTFFYSPVTCCLRKCLALMQNCKTRLPQSEKLKSATCFNLPASSKMNFFPCVSMRNSKTAKNLEDANTSGAYYQRKYFSYFFFSICEHFFLVSHFAMFCLKMINTSSVT